MQRAREAHAEGERGSHRDQRGENEREMDGQKKEKQGDHESEIRRKRGDVQQPLTK